MDVRPTTRLQYFLRFVGRIVLLLAGTVITLLIFFWAYCTVAWRMNVDPMVMKSFGDDMKMEPTLSPQYYSIYDALNGRRNRQTSMEEQTLNAMGAYIFGYRYRFREHCWCGYAAQDIQENKSGGDYKGFRLGWGLQQYVSPARCFDHEVWKFYNDNMRLFHLTPPDQLQDTPDILHFLTLMKRPTYYVSHPERIQQKIDSDLLILRSHN